MAGVRKRWTNKTIDYIVRGSAMSLFQMARDAGDDGSIIGLTDGDPGFYAIRDWSGHAHVAEQGARDIIDVADFGSIGTANDKGVIQTAINALTAGKTLRLHGTLNFNGVVTITTNNVGIWFDDCTINIGDTGTAPLWPIAPPASGFHFKASRSDLCRQPCSLIGTGTVGSTTLAGMVSDECDRHLRRSVGTSNMAAAGSFQWCNHGHFGDIQHMG